MEMENNVPLTEVSTVQGSENSDVEENVSTCTYLSMLLTQLQILYTTNNLKHKFKLSVWIVPVLSHS